MDPYQILGVSRSATDDEVKKAYRNLSRKYHPDANVNNPNKDQAEEMFKRVQQAYDAIMKERQSGGYDEFFGGSYSGGYQENTSEDANILMAAANYINSGYYREAMTALNQLEESRRNGQWYYYAAIASRGLGNLIDARSYASRAVQLEPGNFRYRQLLDALENGSGEYMRRGGTYMNPYAGVSRWCFNLFLINLFCNCCCLGGGYGMPGGFFCF